MSAVLRCCCDRCVGGVFFRDPLAYLVAHDQDAHDLEIVTAEADAFAGQLALQFDRATEDEGL